MLEFYPQVREVHIAAIFASGAWFALRALALLAGMGWPRHIVPRALGWAIDGALLTAATMLWTMLPAALFENQWLTVKLVFVAVYLAAYWSALQPGGRGRTAVLSAIAGAAWLMAYGVARAHLPLGWFAG